jgi:hypothetical protein
MSGSQSLSVSLRLRTEKVRVVSFPFSEETNGLDFVGGGNADGGAGVVRACYSCALLIQSAGIATARDEVKHTFSWGHDAPNKAQ